ncbi:MAG: hypothetical protein GF364_05045 [Candidatus Lokiarchaeota archaeon]|nr:hypothetical protein [Candidatus Lokiarchaeota archaeon]
MDEILFPIDVNPELCVLCVRCQRFCHTDAISFRNMEKFVDYRKCRGCLKCVEMCDHGAIEVVSIDKGIFKGFTIDHDLCKMCKNCIQDGFCLENRYSVIEEKNEDGKVVEKIEFNDKNLSECPSCLKCFNKCPNRAIIPIIEEPED